MIESRWWHPVAAAQDLREQPLGVRVLGRELVLWRDRAERVHAFDDRCPHRGAKLSLGRVHGQELQCGYHGWRFDTAGRCTAIPALVGFEPPASSAVGRHAVASAHGMLWVGLDGVQAAPHRLAGVPAREVVCGPFDVGTAAPRVVENFLDMAHFGFVHEGFLGDRLRAEVPDYEVTLTPDGRPLAPHYRAWQPQASATAGEGAWVDYRYEVLSPFAALLHKCAQDSARAPAEAYALWCCPTDEECTRVWFTLFTSDTATPDDALRTFQQAIFAQDRPIIESQRPRRLPLAGGEAASAADRLSAAYRRYLKEMGISYGVC